MLPRKKMINNLEPLMNDIISDSLDFDSSYTYNGVIVPRVTKIISRCNHSDGLMYWANSLGFRGKSYARTLSEAANIGAQCHNNIDLYLEDNNHKPSDINSQSLNAYKSFLSWFDQLRNNNDVKVIYHEFKITCRWFGGTLDGLYSINNKLYLIDYKTSNHISSNYYLQLAAYRFILRQEMGLDIDGCIILQLSKSDIGYNEFLLDFSIPAHFEFINACERAFLSLVYAYYNLVYIDQSYEVINKWRNST